MNRSDRNSVNVLRCSQRMGRPPSDALFFDSPHSLSGLASVAVVSPHFVRVSLAACSDLIGTINPVCSMKGTSG
jgi:hypothetical protein